MNELKEHLEGITDTYDDFVRGVLLSVKDSEEKELQILKFIKNCSNVTTSMVIDYLDELDGLK